MFLIYVPCKNQKEAEKIGRKLVSENLACCANIIPEIHSIFKWKGELSYATETLLLIKTLSNYEKVRKRIEKMHSYDVPAVACFKLNNINKKYLSWAKKVQKNKR